MELAWEDRASLWLYGCCCGEKLDSQRVSRLMSWSFRILRGEMACSPVLLLYQRLKLISKLYRIETRMVEILRRL